MFTSPNIHQMGRVGTVHLIVGLPRLCACGGYVGVCWNAPTYPPSRVGAGLVVVDSFFTWAWAWASRRATWANSAWSECETPWMLMFTSTGLDTVSLSSLATWM